VRVGTIPDLAPQRLRRVDGGAAAAERIEHHVAGVGGGGEDAFQEGDKASGWNARRHSGA